MASFSIDSASIVRVLARGGHRHRCSRCETRMLVKHASGLCVDCFNGQRTSARVEGDVAAPVAGARRGRLAAVTTPADDAEDPGASSAGPGPVR